MKKIIQEKQMSTEKTRASNTDNENWTSQEREKLRSRYGCEIIKHNCTLEETKDTQVPKDAYIVTYVMNDRICYDLTRGDKIVNIFDMYYDNMGNVINSIDFSYGKINPKLWGYKAPEKKKRK